MCGAVAGEQCMEGEGLPLPIGPLMFRPSVLDIMENMTAGS